MSLPILFKAPLNGIIQKESVKLYQQQLTEKKTHLRIAKESYQESLNLALEFKEKISLATEQLETINNNLLICKDDLEVIKLNQEKKHYECFIESAPQKMTPFIQRLSLLTDNLNKLEAEITAIEEQVRAGSLI